MVVLRPQSNIGEAPPPRTPYAIVTNLPGWDANKALRDGDRSVAAKIVHIYPRLFPTHHAAQVSRRFRTKTERVS